MSFVSSRSAQLDRKGDDVTLSRELMSAIRPQFSDSFFNLACLEKKGMKTVDLAKVKDSIHKRYETACYVS